MPVPRLGWISFGGSNRLFTNVKVGEAMPAAQGAAAALPIESGTFYAA
jgi:hypothetical protein